MSTTTTKKKQLKFSFEEERSCTQAKGIVEKHFPGLVTSVAIHDFTYYLFVQASFFDREVKEKVIAAGGVVVK